MSSAAFSDTFLAWPEPAQGELVELRHGDCVFRVAAWRQGELSLPAGATHYGFVSQGPGNLHGEAGRFSLRSGMYFAIPGEGAVGGDGAGLVISQFGYRGFFHLGGPIERRGRLRYIDGCSDSLLIPPILKGDACLNLLHIPPHTDQTAHTHPSFRVGVVVRGAGKCRAAGKVTQLTPGLVFVIHPDGLHSFHTAGDELAVIAFHPDSDFGPTHEEHPMLNRTIIAGQSAARAAAEGGRHA